MTAEIVLLNKQAVALAADSAVTIQRAKGQKVFLSANKIFSASDSLPIGIMVYGNTSLLGMPWESLVKEFRANRAKEAFKTVGECAEEFFKYVENRKLIPKNIQERAYEYSIHAFCQYVQEVIRKQAKEIIVREGNISLTETKRLASRVVNEMYRNWRKADYLPSATEDQELEVSELYAERIDNEIKKTFQKLPLTAALKAKIRQICSWIAVKLPERVSPPNHSGVVFAGFGLEQMFPSLEAFVVGGAYSNILQYRRDDLNCLRIDFDVSAGLAPFAQRDVVQMFVSGVDPRFGSLVDKLLRRLAFDFPALVIAETPGVSAKNKQALTKELEGKAEVVINSLRDEIAKYRRETFQDPVIQTVASMPKDELAAMAEALVNLTSFSRKVTKEVETVGGPIDVAVISKGDGFVWINRKHYFRRELNPQFFSRRYKEEEDE